MQCSRFPKWCGLISFSGLPRRSALRWSSANGDSSKAFVSKHYVVNTKEIKDLVGRMGTELRTNGDRVEVRVCTLCSKGNKRNADNLWKLYVNQNGSYHCFRCSKAGSWFDLKQRVLASGSPQPLFAPAADEESELAEESEAGGAKRPIPDQIEAFLYTKVDRCCNQFTLSPNNTLFIVSQVLFGSSGLPYAHEALLYLLKVRKLSSKILLRYGVGVSIQSFMNEDNKYIPETCITFPWYAEASDGAADGASESAGVIERVKHRALTGKGRQRLLPKGGEWGFFGWHLVRPTDITIIITEGEFDAMAVAQVISELPEDHPFYRVPSVSLPNGCNSLPPSLLQRLERFTKIYLWMDNDDAGIAGSQKFAMKLGIKRCYLVNPPLPIPGDCTNLKFPKDANDALRDGSDMISLLQRAYLTRHDKILTFSDLRAQALLSKNDSVQFEGTATPSIPKLTKTLKGFRKGELILFTGPTGCGKCINFGDNNCLSECELFLFVQEKLPCCLS